MFKKYTVTRLISSCNYKSMARSGNSKAVQKTPQVTFSIEVRPATTEQQEAGKRLFSMLLARAQSSTKTSKESKRVDGKA